MKTYDSRKEQIEKVFLPMLIRALQNEGVVVQGRGRNLLREALRDAAMVGAYEERGRTLGLTELPDRVYGQIISASVLRVLGYE